MVGRLQSRCLWWLLVIWVVCIGTASAERVLIGVNSAAATADALAAVGGRVVKHYDRINVDVADIPDGQLASLQGKHGVRFAESDAPTRKLGGSQVVTWGVEKIGAPAAWQISRGRGVRVGVLDTGIDAASYDLRVVGGYTAAGVGGDYLSDLDGHGTHTAGTLAALDNQVAMVGVAPQAELYSIKVLGDTGSGTVSALIDGIMWAVQNHMQVLNISLSTTKDSQALREACQAAYDAGLILVAAAGNGGKRNGNQNTIEYPAAYPVVIAVGAVDKLDVRASFSATGSAQDLMAPGVDVVSLLPGDQKGTGTGTSMAAPHVAGVAALVWASNPAWSNAQVIERLLSTAFPIGNGDPTQYGRGRVDAAAAVGTRSAPAQPGVALQATVDATPTVVGKNGVVTITVSVCDSNAKPVTGASVVLTVYTPAGTSFTTPGYSDASGKAVFRLRTRQNDGRGAYNVRAQVSKTGYVSAVVNVSGLFTVQ